MKKYIEIDGVKHYIKGDPETDEPVVTEPVVEPEEVDDEAVQKTAKALGAAMRKELGLDDLKKSIEQVQELVNDPINEKLKAILHGKDVIRDKNQLTSDEKIVGFFHALVTNNERAQKALSEGVAADGGNLFPAEFVSELIKPLSQAPRMRSLVTVRTMRRNVMTVPAQGNVAKVYWTAENAPKTTTTASWNQVTLTARKAAAIIYASDELIEDSTEIDVVREIIAMFAQAIGDAEDFAILRGNGTTQPTGLETARAAGTIASTAVGVNLDHDDIIDLVYSLRPQYRNGASFLAHPNSIRFLRKLKDSQNRYLWADNNNLVDRAFSGTLQGYPVYEFYDLPTSVTFFGNWKLAYWMGDRKQMSVKISNDTSQAFTNDETAIRVVMRIAGNVVLGEAAKAITHAAL